jgi:hypothetical protein
MTYTRSAKHLRMEKGKFPMGAYIVKGKRVVN